MPEKSRELDIKEYIQKAAENAGLDGAAAIAMAEKCYADMPMLWQPYGGATSFSEIDTQRTADFYNSRVQSETSALEGIIHNITQSEMSADEKASKIAAAADDYRGRIAALDESKQDPYNERATGIKALTGSFLKTLKNVVIGAPRDTKLATGFRMIEDNQGNLRWLSFSSNAFEDKYQQLFSTKALEEAVEYAEKSGDRGPLLLFHQWPARIGTCDFQAVSGRFLVESGTFDDTLYGQRAVEYFLDHQEEPFQVSIGFAFKDGDEKDGVYDWTRIRERSVLPQGKAANQWTDFRLVGDERMRTDAKAFLDGVLGSDEADKVVAEAAKMTQDLESKGIRHREAPEIHVMTDEEAGEITGVKQIEELVADKMYQVEEHGHGDVAHTHRFEVGSEHTHEGVKASYKAMKKSEDDEDEEDEKSTKSEEESVAKKEAPELGEQVQKLALGMAGIMETLGGLKETLDVIPALQEDIKSLKATDEERMAAIMQPRWAGVPGGIRPSEANNNLVVDPAIINGMREQGGDDAEGAQKLPVNPAAVYVEDLFKPGARIQQG